MEVPFLGWEDCACRNIEPQVHTNQVSVQLVPRPGHTGFVQHVYPAEAQEARHGVLKPYVARIKDLEERLSVLETADLARSVR